MATTRLTNKPIPEVIAAIDALDLDSVKARLMDPVLGEGWSQDYADSIESAYKTYLTMLAKYQEHAEEIMLAKDVDEFWHTHILQTMKYMDDCQKVFGTYLHHAPHIGEVTAADLQKREALAEKTRELYAREFGADVDAAWLGASAAKAAYSGAALDSGEAAYSGTALAPEQAAYSGAAIQAQRSAYSGAAVNTTTAAYSGAAIKTARAAYSGVAVHERRAAYSGAAVRAQNAAYSGAAIVAESAAYSGAAVKAANAAYSGASVHPQKAAYSGAAIRT